MGRIEKAIEIRAPPGCYIIRGYAPCLSVTSARLLPAGVRTCITRLTTALQSPEIRNKTPRQHVEAAIKALKEVAEYLPHP